MAQHDFNIANQSFPSFRTDLNNALSAINTSQSGTSRPSGAVAGTIWLDTTSATTPTLKYYDGADDISLATLDHSANTVNWLDSTVSVTGLTTTATGTVLTLSDSATTSTVNLIIDNDKEIRFREATANGTNYISLSAPASLSADVTYTLPTAPASNNRALISSTAGVMSYTPYSFPSADGTASQVLQTNGSGVLSFASGGGAIKQVVSASDGTIYEISIPDAFTDVAGSIAYSITPTSASNKIIINFSIGQFRSSVGGGGRIRIYRQINSTGGFSHVSALSNTDSGNKIGAVVSNMHGLNSADEDANRSRNISMMVVDSPATTSLVEYKIYVGHGDGAGYIWINRTPNNSDNSYTGRTKTHVTLMETS
jgi:hypothetical protein